MKILTHLLLLLTTLLCRPAFCGEIYDAAKAGDLEKVKALLKDNPINVPLNRCAQTMALIKTPN